MKQPGEKYTCGRVEARQGKTAKVREKAKQAIFETKHVAKNSTHNCLTERYHPRISTSSFDSCHLLILNSGEWRQTIRGKLLTEKGVNPQTKLSCYWHKNYDTVLFFGHTTHILFHTIRRWVKPVVSY